MENEREKSLLTIVRELFDAYYQHITGVFELARLEAKLAIRSIIIITILLFISLVLVLSAWVSLLAVEYCLFITLHLQPLTASSLVALTNLLLLGICFFSILRLKQNLYFTATRKQLVSPFVDKEPIHEQIEEANRSA